MANVAPPSKTLRRLIELYGNELGIPPGPERQQALFLSARSRELREELHESFSFNWIHALLIGKADDTHLQPRKARALIEIFRKINPTLSPICFSEPLSKLRRSERSSNGVDEQTDHSANASADDIVSLHIPGHRARVDEQRGILPGTYIMYRYAFERSRDHLVSREVLHIDPDLSFRMSFLTQVDREKQPVYEFKGHVIPIGQALFFVGTNMGGKGFKARGRSLFLFDERHERLRHARLGILAGTRLFGDMGGCAAVTVVIRCAKTASGKGVRALMEAVTRNATFDTLIKTDFGSAPRRLRWLKIFLDNRPAQTAQAKFIASEEVGFPPEATLRVHLERFNQRMPEIIEAVQADARARAPFKTTVVKRSKPDLTGLQRDRRA